MVVMAGFAAPVVFAAGAPAGTSIPNSATLAYSIAGRPAAPVTAVAPVVVVAELINVVLTWQDGTPVAVNSPDAARALTFVLTNTGNGSEAFGLTRNNLIAGDQFDPTNAAAGAIYLESGVEAGFQATGPNADILYVPGVNDPVLTPDASRTVYVLSSIPAAQANGAIGNVNLAANSLTTGAAGALPGTTLAGLGQGGVDAVVGSSRGQSNVTGGYIVSGMVLSVAKTVAAVRDPMGGSLVMPGAVMTYRVALTLTGAGTAEALTFSDPLPASTTYVPASITVDGVARSDAADADNANFALGVVGVLFGNTVAPATRVVEFKVTVN